MTPAADPRRYDVVILGAGVTGLVSASVLAEQSAGSILVLDEYDHVGGNHIDRTIGEYTFDVGSLIFQDDSPLVARFPELMESYHPIDPSWARVNPQHKVTMYPFSIHDDVVAAGPLEWVWMAASLVRSRLFGRRLSNARDFAVYWLGARLLRRSGLERYMERLCGLPPDQIDLEFAQSRMLWISEYARVGKQLRALFTPRRKSPAPKRMNQQLVRPRSGFAELYRPVVATLRGQSVEFELGVSLDGIERDGDDFVIHTASGPVRTSRIVSTIPVGRALALAGIAAPALPTVTLVTLYFSFSGVRGFGEPILYNFTYDGTWKRLTMHSDFYGEAEGREYLAVEVVDMKSVPSIDRSAQQFREHTAANGLFDGDLRLEGGGILANAYPIFTEGSSRSAADVVSQLREFGFESVGRQGGFEYQPTSRVSTIVAERALGAKDRPPS